MLWFKNKNFNKSKEKENNNDIFSKKLNIENSSVRPFSEFDEFNITFDKDDINKIPYLSNELKSLLKNFSCRILYRYMGKNRYLFKVQENKEGYFNPINLRLRTSETTVETIELDKLNRFISKKSVSSINDMNWDFPIYLYNFDINQYSSNRIKTINKRIFIIINLTLKIDSKKIRIDIVNTDSNDIFSWIIKLTQNNRIVNIHNPSIDKILKNIGVCTVKYFATKIVQNVITKIFRKAIKNEQNQ